MAVGELFQLIESHHRNRIVFLFDLNYPSCPDFLVDKLEQIRRQYDFDDEIQLV